MSSSRKWFLILLAAGGSLVVASRATMIHPATGPIGRPTRAARASPRSTPPNVSFAPGVTSGNEQVDAFVGRSSAFAAGATTSSTGLLDRLRDPDQRHKRFQSMWRFARKVVITQITPVPETAKAMQPAYLIKASVELDPKAKITGEERRPDGAVGPTAGPSPPPPAWSRPPNPSPATDTEPAG